METGGTGIGRLDCYEDMFKEITRKLYGEDPDHRTSSVQNEFETSVTFKTEQDMDNCTFKTEEDTDNCTDVSDDGSWTVYDEPLKGTEGSRIAAYRASTSTWRCYECGDCMGGGPREVAEHFVELHSSRIINDEGSRGRLQSSRNLNPNSNDLKLEEVVAYLERVRDRAERSAPPTRRTQETQTVPAALLPMTSSFLLQELPTTPPQHLHQNSLSIAPNTGTTSTNNSSHSNSGSSASGNGNTNSGGGATGNNASGKRYTCLYCPYGTDRRDLYTRHENIHREEKPFHCYVCYKPFSRADHVKKHFLRMHREHTYELSRIRKPAGSSSSTPKPPINIQQSESNNQTITSSNNSNNTNQYTNSIYSNPKQPQVPASIATATTTYQLQAPNTTNTSSSSVHSASAALYQAASVVAAAAAAANATNIMQADANCTTTTQQLAAVHNAAAQAARRLQNGVSNKSLKSASSSKANQERRYTCCYCSWSGVDNWCLKRHLNTHLKPFACALCEYKAARAERLATHVLKVHNRRQCSRCSFLAEDLAQLQLHQLHVHRVSNANIAAAAAAAASATAQQQQQQQQQNSITQQQSQSNNNRQQQPPSLTQLIHPVGGGRPPPGPPVFPASSAAIAPATTVIPPTTILGIRSEIASMPGIACWVQETSSCEKRFNQSTERRSRKQRTPRRIMTNIGYVEKNQEEETKSIKEPKDNNNKHERIEKINLTKYRCFLCQKKNFARAYRTRSYHTRASLFLHKLWRHKKPATKKLNTKVNNKKTVPALIRMKANVYTGRAYNYQR